MNWWLSFLGCIVKNRSNLRQVFVWNWWKPAGVSCSQWHAKSCKASKNCGKIAGKSRSVKVTSLQVSSKTCFPFQQNRYHSLPLRVEPSTNTLGFPINLISLPVRKTPTSSPSPLADPQHLAPLQTQLSISPSVCRFLRCRRPSLGQTHAP